MEEKPLSVNATVAPENVNEVEDNSPAANDQVEDASEDASDASEQKSATLSLHGNFAREIFAFLCVMALIM